jgi:hypothetical protein
MQNGMQATGLPQVQNKIGKSCLLTTLFASFSSSLTSSQCKRTELTMTSKASNLNAGLNRLVWKEGERIQALPIFVLLLLPHYSVKGGLNSIIWAAINFV